MSTPDELLRTGTTLSLCLLSICALLLTSLPNRSLPGFPTDSSHDSDLTFPVTFIYCDDGSARASGLRWPSALHRGTVYWCEEALLPSRSLHNLDREQISGGQCWGQKVSLLHRLLTQVCIQADFLGPQVSRPMQMP